MSGKAREKQAWLKEAARHLRAGGVVVVPTETFYGLAADPFNSHAVAKIFALKGRQSGKPLPLIASDRAVVTATVEDPGFLAGRIMDTFWPGSVTILLRPNRPFSDHLTGPGGKIGVRVPPPCAAGALAGETGGWITATSANLSGDENPDEICKIGESVLNGADFVVDLGRTPGGLPSTVVEPVHGVIKFIRDGAVPRKILEELVQRNQQA